MPYELTEVEETIAVLKAKTGQDLKLNVVQNMEESAAQLFLLEHESRLPNSNRIRIFAIVSVRLYNAKSSKKTPKAKKNRLCPIISDTKLVGFDI